MTTRFKNVQIVQQNACFRIVTSFAMKTFQAFQTFHHLYMKKIETFQVTPFVFEKMKTFSSYIICTVYEKIETFWVIFEKMKIFSSYIICTVYEKIETFWVIFEKMKIFSSYIIYI